MTSPHDDPDLSLRINSRANFNHTPNNVPALYSSTSTCPLTVLLSISAPIMPGDPRGSQSNDALPLLEDLIAKHGDSSNTTWIEDKFKVWRHDSTGAAVGYAPSDHNYCIIWGNPLCEHSQYIEAVDAFLQFTQALNYKPIWACVSEEVEKILTQDKGWRAVMCVQEDALDPTTVDPEQNKEVRKHIRAAQKKGCKIMEEDGEPADEVKKEIDQVIKEWKAHRRGTQVHVTNVEPWRDIQHRRYFYARDAEGKVSTLSHCHLMTIL